jgi:hypothetical protein
MTNKLNYYRNQKWVRLLVIGLLILLVLVLYFRNVDTSNLNSAEGIKEEFSQSVKPDTWEKKLLLGVLGILGVAGGMEVANTDFDVKKLIETKGDFSASKVLRDKSGNILTEEDLKQGKQGKYTDEYDCKDFSSQSESQVFYNNAGGVEGDTNRLDGNKDGVPCQALPKGVN